MYKKDRKDRRGDAPLEDWGHSVGETVTLRKCDEKEKADVRRSDASVKTLGPLRGGGRHGDEKERHGESETRRKSKDRETQGCLDFGVLVLDFFCGCEGYGLTHGDG